MGVSDACLSIAADVYNRYPSEALTFSVRPDEGVFPAGHTLLVSIPPEMKVDDFSFSASGQDGRLSEHAKAAELRWVMPHGELLIHARVDAGAPEGHYLALASAVSPEETITYQTGVQIMVKRYAETLRYLPEIYTRDDFTNRFLMLIESFWKPISQQIDQTSNYFDPRLAPTEFIPWLGAWFGLALEDDLPENTKRQILNRIAPIYARKGTRQSLETFLRLYTGGEVTVREHRDENLVLGESARLGYQIALGKNNHPYSFDITIQAPVKDQEGASISPEQYRRRVEALIDLFKPAHTVYHLDIRTESA
ncbi:MAG TPA: phage tail protein [Anaerolineaceae bacterium]|nr:phage tail protein [Anaerolineaceae bacterium]